MCNKRQRVYLVGVGMGSANSLTEQARQIFKECDCIIGAKRMVEGLVTDHTPCFQSYQPEEIADFLNAHSAYERVAVALSGDPGFYSGAKKLQTTLTGCDIRIIPGISSVVYLAAALGISWEDAAIVSIHGRKQNFIHAVHTHVKTFLLFGGGEAGKLICEKIRYYGLDEVEFCIGKQLSYEDEQIIRKTGADLTEADFEGLAAAYIFNPHPDTRICAHIEDDAFIRGKVPMTKREIRTVSLASLRLTTDAVLYDVGAGTGSVGIEAAVQAGTIRVYAIEKNLEGIALIRQNCQKFCCDNVDIVEGLAPRVLEPLEPPTHVFIGGSSGNLKEIIGVVKAKNPQVRIVLNAISLETVKEAMEAIEEGLLENAEIVQLTAARSRKLGAYHMMTGQNPVYIISAGA